MAFTFISLQDKKPVQVPVSEISKIRRPSGLRGPDEAFSFRKTVSVLFGFNDEVLNYNFNGHLFMQWDHSRMATVSLSMPDHAPDIFIRAHFTDDYTLKCMETPVKLDEKESEYIVLIKSLVLDYAFKTLKDDNGEYQAILKFQDKEATKSKTAYTAPDKAGLKVKKSLHKIRMDERLLEAAGEEEFILHFNNEATAQTKTNYILKALTTEIKRPAINEERELGHCTSDFSAQSDLISGVNIETFKTLLSTFEGLERGERQLASRKILKGLRSNPEFISDFMAWTYSIQTDSKLSAMAIGILGSLGTEAAQKELVSLFESSLPGTGHLKFQVLNAFTLTEAPLIESTRRFLKFLVKSENASLSEGAAYALGSSIANNGRDEDLSFLVNELEKTDSIRRKLTYLDALRNSGSTSVIPVLKKYASSDTEDQKVKEAATEIIKTLKL